MGRNGTVDMKDLFDRSIVVVAHPDDEALWFGSVLSKVNALTICYLDIPSEPEISEGRKRCLDDYPVRNTTWLGLTESEASVTVKWWKHITSDCGMSITGNRRGSQKYTENYYVLQKTLREQLKTYRNVFTHNPWGEYGHAEHVQVYRAVKSLQEELGFNIWYSNYCSQTTFDFMLTFINSCESRYFNFNVDTNTAENLRDLYLRNDCWTWYKNWKWFRDECFIEDSFFYPNKDIDFASHLFPLNIIKMPESKGGNSVKKITRRILLNWLPL